MRKVVKSIVCTGEIHSSSTIAHVATDCLEQFDSLGLMKCCFHKRKEWYLQILFPSCYQLKSLHECELKKFSCCLRICSFAGSDEALKWSSIIVITLEIII